ncbi:unnamed protein product [Adineta steineri]|uniref:Endonuclease n=1 Tax=Adineta steineri TaxID=433720 RepID=A0A815VBH6_9BILA|nr:unnamed protein product [Adineta steineri]CAF1653240.1 unnamed protein product [Adineta steineri]
MKILIDTGAQHCFINRTCLKNLDQLIYHRNTPQQFFMADGLNEIKTTGIVHLSISIGDATTSIPAFITTNLCTDIILGLDYLLKYDLEIYPKKKLIIFNFNNQKIMIQMDSKTSLTDHSLQLSNLIQSTPMQQLNTLITTSFNNTQQSILKLINHTSNPDQHYKLQSLLFQFESTFDISNYKIAQTEITHFIETIPHTPPVSKAYPGNPTINAELKIMIDQLLDAGLICTSQSPYAAPTLLVKKKDQSWRLVNDYKKLNSITIKDNYPLPNMEITLQSLGAGYSFFSKLDLKSGFWQLPINPSDRAKTAFITPFGLFEWLVLPQGLRNSPPTFQRTMRNVLSSCTDCSLIYLDDIVVFSHTYDEHLLHLNKVLNALKLHNLTLNPEKCELAKEKIEYLGHIISSNIITPLPYRIKSIIALPEPKSLSKANRFIGSLSWYRKFIPAFASVAAPIHAVTNLSELNRHKFKWGSEQSKSFYDLKNILTSSPLFLNFPDDKYPVFLSTDASQVGLGGILYQEIDNEKRILYYHSELLNATQKRYIPIELEALAIFKCFTRMKSFLLGRDIIIYTDNCPICHMMDKKILNRRVEKISILLQEFNIQKIIHVKGKYNCLPDYLSRHPITAEDELLDHDYGLGFKKDKSSSIQLIGAITRSKSKITPQQITSSSPSQHTTSSSSPSQHITSSSSPSPSNDLNPDKKFFDITKLKEYQSNDKQVQKIINDLQKNTNMTFVYQDGILYKLVSIPHGKTKRKLFYIPSSMIKQLLISYHDNPLIGGHFAIRRTLEKLKKQFWWPEMKQTVIDHIKSCVPCQAFNVNRQKSAGFLHPIPPPDGPNQLLGMDFCGPFPITPQENKYVLCLTDYFTKFIVAVALPSCSAGVTAEAIFKNYICQFGVPKVIISDQGTSFKNNLMYSLSKLIGYHHIFCTPYRPQSNGAVERFNGTFVIQLAKLTDNETNNWDEYLYPIVFAYNTGVHSTTNISPYALTFGRQANLPTDPPVTTLTLPDPHDYFRQLVLNLKYYHQTVKEIILKQQQKTKGRYDYHRKNPEYDLGTTVLTRVFTNRSKLDPRFSIDPKIIVENHHPIYTVEDMDTKRIAKVHVSDIRPLLLPDN